MLEAILPNVPAGTSPAWYYVAVGGAVLIIGIAKAGFGGGIGVLAVPLMASVMSPGRMLGMMLPVLIACDIFSNLHYLREYDWKRLRALVPGLLVGVGAGTIALLFMQEMPPTVFIRMMNGVIGFMCLAVVAMQAYRLTGRELPTLPPHPLSGGSIGFAAGAVSTLTHSAGPIVLVYLLQEKLAKRPLVATMLLYFLIGNTAKVLPYALIKAPTDETYINWGTLHDSIWFIPLIPIGTLLGAWMNRRVAEKPFAVIMYSAAGVTAFDLICKAVWEVSIFNPAGW